MTFNSLVNAKQGNTKGRRSIQQVPVKRGEQQHAAAGQLQIGSIVDLEAVSELQDDRSSTMPSLGADTAFGVNDNPVTNACSLWLSVALGRKVRV